MKLTRKKAMEFNIVFNLLASLKGKLRFHYTLRKNIETLKEEIGIINNLKQTLSELSAEQQEYEDTRIALCKQYAEKDENNKPKEKPLENGLSVFVFTAENEQLVNKELTNLAEEYKEVLSKDKLDKEEFVNFIEEEIELALLKFKLSDMPLDENIEQKYINCIFELIEED